MNQPTYSQHVKSLLERRGAARTADSIYHDIGTDTVCQSFNRFYGIFLTGMDHHVGAELLRLGAPAIECVYYNHPAMTIGFNNLKD